MGKGKKMKMSKIQYFKVSPTSLDAEFHAEFDFNGPGAGGSQKGVVFDEFMIFPENCLRMDKCYRMDQNRSDRVETLPECEEKCGAYF